MIPDLKGTREIGRFRLRWEDGAIHDIRALGANNWRNVENAKVHTRLSSQ